MSRPLLLLCHGSTIIIIPYYSTTDANPVDAADDNDVDGDVAVGDAGEADGDDGTIFSSCKGM